MDERAISRILTAIPYVIEHHPANALILVNNDAALHLQLPDNNIASAAQFVAELHNVDVGDEALAVFYTPDPQLAGFGVACLWLKSESIPALMVNEGRYWVMSDDAPDSPGHTFVADPEVAEELSERTGGQLPAIDADELAAAFDQQPTAEFLAAVAAAGAEFADLADRPSMFDHNDYLRREAMWMFSRVSYDQAPLSDSELARLSLVIASDSELRDFALALVDRVGSDNESGYVAEYWSRMAMRANARMAGLGEVAAYALWRDNRASSAMRLARLVLKHATPGEGEFAKLLLHAIRGDQRPSSHPRLDVLTHPLLLPSAN